MRPLRVYIDTSVIGGYYDQEFDYDSKMLFEKFRKNGYPILEIRSPKEIIDYEK